jgi:hypothetical protein
VSAPAGRFSTHEKGAPAKVRPIFYRDTPPQGATTMRPFRTPSPAPARATSPRTLPAFAPGVDDPARAIFDRVLVRIRSTEPSLAHHPLHELELRYADLFGEIAEIIDSL